MRNKLNDLWLVLSIMFITNLTILLRGVIEPMIFLLKNHFSLVIFDLLLFVLVIILLHLIVAIKLIQRWKNK